MSKDIPNHALHKLHLESDIPDVARYWPPKPAVNYVDRIGTKCLVVSMPDRDGYWLEVGGVSACKEDMQDQDDGSRTGVSADPNQARIYFRNMGEDAPPICRILLPDDFHFRSSLKGMVKGRSKSFDENGDPLPEVLLLYALKTGHYDDRVRAVEAFPTEVWGADTFGQLFRAMDDAARTDHNFRTFAGEQLTISAREKGGLADWSLWEKVAYGAAETKQAMLARNKLKEDNLNQSLFMRSVNETTIENQGLTAQIFVETRWRKLGGQGDWRETRDRLGFKWLPGDRDWKKSWSSSGPHSKWWLPLER